MISCAVLLALAACRGEPPTGTCGDLPRPPFRQSPTAAHANEDLTFDADGLLVGADNQTNLWRTDAEGNRTLAIPDSGVSAGLRLMPWDGALVSAQYQTNAVFRIDLRTGSRIAVVTSLSTPTGIEIGPDRTVWISELHGGRIQRYHPETDELEVVVDGLLRPNGLTFDRSYSRLYIADTEAEDIVMVDIDPGTLESVGEPEVFVSGAGDGIDGLSVDACGNVYAAWWSQARIERWSEDGSRHEVLVDEPDAPMGLGNFAWGSAAGGFDPDSIYVVEQGPATVRAVEIGVRSKPPPEQAARAARRL